MTNTNTIYTATVNFTENGATTYVYSMAFNSYADAMNYAREIKNKLDDQGEKTFVIVSGNEKVINLFC